MKRKILFITTISGFLYQFEMNDVKILQEAGYEIHYASNMDIPVYKFDREALEKQGIIFHHVSISKKPTKLVQNYWALKQIRKIIREEGIDVVHVHNPMGGVIGRLAAFLEKHVYIIYTAHGFHFYKGAPLINWLLYYTAEKLLARCTDQLITINQEDYQRAKKFRLRKGGRVSLIPGVGIDTKRFAASMGEKAAVRKQLEIPEDAFYIISVGELNDNKNHKVIIEAVEQLNNPNVYYGICGRGEKKKELKELIKAKHLEDRVFLYGFRDDIPSMLSAADCFAFPSIREGLGIAAIEAMAAGLPLITSDCRGTREYAIDKVNGIVCKSGSAEEYRKAIEEIMGNPQRTRAMSSECKRLAPKYDVQATDKIMREVYAEINS